MVYIAYFPELILQICDFAQKRRIWRENCKYALNKNCHCHFCSRRKAAKFCHPGVCRNRPKESFWSKIIWWELSSQPCILNFITVIPENTHVLAVALKCAALPWPSLSSISSKWGRVGDTTVPHNPWVVPHDRKKTCTTKKPKQYHTTNTATGDNKSVSKN